MLVAILSDSHGNLANVRRALEIIQERKVDCILHCGDIDDSETLLAFAGTTAHFVLGNCDDDGPVLARAAREAGVHLHGRFADLELAGKRIALIHGDDAGRLREIEALGTYDYLFYGHTHAAERHRTGPTLVLNPGALHRARPKTMVLLDPELGRMEWITVAE